MIRVAYTIVAITLFLAIFRGALDASAPRLEERILADQAIEFQIYYPFVQIRATDVSVERRNQSGAGVGFNYQLYWSEIFGLAIYPASWFVPLKIGGSNAMYKDAALSLGPSFRFFKDSWVAPRLQVLGGVSLADAGGRTRASVQYLAKGVVSLNLYRQTAPYKDTELALAVVTQADYVFSRLKFPNSQLFSPLVYHVGLSLKGAF